LRVVLADVARRDPLHGRPWLSDLRIVRAAGGNLAVHADLLAGEGALMAAFYVGQRVRVKFVVSPNLAQFVGMETTIVGPLHDFYFAHAGEVTSGYYVALHPRFCPGPDQLEPIKPAGLESLDEINSLFEPAPCTADEALTARAIRAGEIAMQMRVMGMRRVW
jgi:hypothetical protein